MMSLECHKAGHLACKDVNEACREPLEAIRSGVGRLSGLGEA